MDRQTLRERKSHGTSLFPLATYDNYDRFPYYSRRSMYVHWHDELEFVVVDSGRARFRVNEREIEVGPGEGLFIPAGTIHSAVAIHGEEFRFTAVVFRPEVVQGILEDPSEVQFLQPLRAGSIVLDGPFGSSTEWGARVLADLAAIVSLDAEHAPGYELGIKSRLFSVFHVFLSGRHFDSVTASEYSAYFGRLKGVLRHIHSSFAEKIPVDDMAARCNLSKYHFIRVFHRTTGRTPVEYLNHYRILQACRILEDERPKILEVALRVGFNDLSYFNRVFVRETRMTPSRYRATLHGAISSKRSARSPEQPPVS